MGNGPPAGQESSGVGHLPTAEPAGVGNGRAEAQARLLIIVRELALELQPRKGARLDVRLDSDLDRDLGLDSLGRAELLHRLDRAFKVRLPERLIGDAATPKNLLEGVLAARPGGFVFAARTEPRAVELPEAVEPLRARTLLEALEAHVRAHGSRPHIRLWLSDEEERTITYGDLDHGARRAAAGLSDLGLQTGERVAIMLPTGGDFFHAFFAVL
ncbi:MAG: AMP-binding protein, partial [Hyphomicrobiaceae bacterium]